MVRHQQTSDLIIKICSDCTDESRKTFYHILLTSTLSGLPTQCRTSTTEFWLADWNENRTEFNTVGSAKNLTKGNTKTNCAPGHSSHSFLSSKLGWQLLSTCTAFSHIDLVSTIVLHWAWPS